MTFMSTAFGRREVSSTSLFALEERAGDAREDEPGWQLRMPVVALVRGYTRASACTKVHIHICARVRKRLSSSRAVRRRSSNSRQIQNKRSRRLCAIATGRATVLENRRRDRGSRTASRRMHSPVHLRCIPRSPKKTVKPPAHARPRRPTYATMISTRCFS